MAITKKDVHQAYLEAAEAHLSYIESERVLVAAQLDRDSKYRNHIQTKDRLRFLKEEEIAPLPDSPDLVRRIVIV